MRQFHIVLMRLNAAIALALPLVQGCGGVTDGAAHGDPGRTGGKSALEAGGSGVVAGAGGSVSTGGHGSGGSLVTAGASSGGSAGQLLIVEPPGNGGSAGEDCTPFQQGIPIEFTRDVTVDAGAGADAGGPSCDAPMPGLPVTLIFSPERVNVTFTTAVNEQVVPSVSSASDCSATDPRSLAWFFDDTGNPKHIEFCPSSCSLFAQQPGAYVTVYFGCPIHPLGGP